MRLEIPYSYSPTLTFDARRLLPNGALDLPGKAYVDIPELSPDQAPVAAVIQNATSGRKSEWRSDGSRWFVPLSVGSTACGPSDKALDMKTLAGLVAAGFVAMRSPREGIGGLEQGVAVQGATSGEALLQMLERQNPRNPSSGQNRNIIDSGDRKQAESSAIASWRKLGIVSIGGEAWQTVAEPVIVFRPPGRLEVLPKDAIAIAGEGSQVFPLDAWDAAAARCEEIGRGKPRESLVELVQTASSPSP